MSSLSFPRPKKVSDGQFIGDLTKLLERRKIKCGDPQSLETFSSELASNNILRSDLFTLCTAISHMASEDLSGEQLLVLVGRAVGGAEVGRGHGAAGIPESMRSAFLTGYEAWGNRGSELNEPLPWPPPRPQIVRSEPLPPADDSTDVPDTVAVKAPPSGLHTIQEALDIAKKRSPIGLAPPRSAPAGTNIEGLTISELKSLLADIESRMSRIQPQLRQLNSAVDPPARDFKRRDRADELDDVFPLKSAAIADQPLAPPSAPLPPAVAASLAMIDYPELAAVLPQVPPHLSDDAFLARHSYMNPKRRNVRDLPIPVLPVIPIDAPPAPVPAAVPAATAPVPSPIPLAAAPQAVPAAAAVDVPAPAPVVAPVEVGPPAIPVAAAVDVPVPAPVVTPVEVGPPAIPVAETSASLVPVPPPAPPPAATPARPPAAVTPQVNGAPVIGLNPIGAALVFALDNLRASPRMMLAVAAILMLIPIGFAGAIVYQYLHFPIIIKYPDPAPPKVIQALEVPAEPLAGDVPTIPSATDAVSSARPAPRPQPPTAHNATSRADAARQSRSASRPQPQAYVWPPPPESVSGGETAAPARPLVATATSTLPPVGAARTPHLTGAPANAIYVPSSTMIKYAVFAPKPVYPVDRAKGMDGTVVLQITISREGDVTSTKTVSGPVELRSAAVQAVRRWRFTPYLLNGNPVDVETTMELPFKPQ